MSTKDYYLEGIARHDKKVIEEVYKKFAHRIEKHIIKAGGNSEDAKDVFQDAFMVLYRKAKEPDFQLSSQFYTYLFGVCRFLWDRKRKKKANNTVTILPNNRYISEDDLEGELIQAEKMSLYRRKFALLGENCQQLLQLFFAKKSMNLIAEELGLPNANAVTSKKYRCIKKLEELMKEDMQFDELIHGEDN